MPLIYIAKHPFQGDAYQQQLSFPHGAEIEAEENQHGQWWWGRYNNQMGWFPPSYVQISFPSHAPTPSNPMSTAPKKQGDLWDRMQNHLQQQPANSDSNVEDEGFMGAPMGGAASTSPQGRAVGFGISPSTGVVGGFGATKVLQQQQQPRNLDSNAEDEGFMAAPMGGTTCANPQGRAGGFGASPSTGVVGGFGTTPSSVYPDVPHTENEEHQQNEDRGRRLPRFRTKSSTNKNAGVPPEGQGYQEDYKGNCDKGKTGMRSWFQKRKAKEKPMPYPDQQQPQPQNHQPVPVTCPQEEPVMNNGGGSSCSHSRGRDALHGAYAGAFVGGLAGGRQGRRAGAVTGAVVASKASNSYDNSSSKTGCQSRSSQQSAGRNVLSGAMSGAFVGSLVGGRRTALAGAAIGSTVAAGNHCSGPGGEAVRSAGGVASAAGDRIGQQEVGDQSISHSTQETKERVGEAWRDGCKGLSKSANNLSSRIKKSA